MIVEVRSYKTKPGLRSQFMDFFEKRALPANRAQKMPVLGPLLSLECPDSFIWLRAFASLDERERLKHAFYEGRLWKEELEAIAMPMLASHAAVLTEASQGYASFDGSRVVDL